MPDMGIGLPRVTRRVVGAPAVPSSSMSVVAMPPDCVSGEVPLARV